MLRRYFQGGVNKYLDDQSGKVIIVTGSNTGIGYQTALQLAKLGGTVVLGCRDSQRGLAAEQSIRSTTGNQQVHFIPLDLGDKASIQAFTQTFLQKHSALHLLINNAGVMMPAKRLETKEGWEVQMGTNHLGHFYLTHLLIDRLEHTVGSRVVNVSSMAHGWAGRLDMNNLLSQQHYSPKLGYGQSKLANIFFTRSLARRYPSIMCTSLHPGVVKTELSRHLISPLMVYIFYPFLLLVSFFMKDSNAGAQTSLYCALAPNHQLLNGQYYADCALKKTFPNAIDTTQDEELLWKKSCEILDIKWD